MGAAMGALATYVWADTNLVWPVPECWSLEAAATVPGAYITALYALHTRGKLEAGQKVLVHAGTGAVGQAAISIALAQECQFLPQLGLRKRSFSYKSAFLKSHRTTLETRGTPALRSKF